MQKYGTLSEIDFRLRLKQNQRDYRLSIELLSLYLDHACFNQVFKVQTSLNSVVNPLKNIR